MIELYSCASVGSERKEWRSRIKPFCSCHNSGRTPVARLDTLSAVLVHRFMQYSPKHIRLNTSNNNTSQQLTPQNYQHGSILLRFPDESLTHITCYLDPESLLALWRCCKKLAGHLEKDNTWCVSPVTLIYPVTNHSVGIELSHTSFWE